MTHSSSHSPSTGFQPDATVAGFVPVSPTAQSQDAARQESNLSTPTLNGSATTKKSTETSDQAQLDGTSATVNHAANVNSAVDDAKELNGTSDELGQRQRGTLDRRESQIGKMVGNFLIEAEIASGGMGTVYRAMQVKPVRREVALKMIRRGLDDEETLQRFRSERQALAIMDHPNIAKIYEADTTPYGNPYFAMEYCHGLPIRKFCQENSLDIEARISLMIQLARAVQSAHRLGVVHRDLKPDNVLVSLREGQPELKVIDFGIAKFNDQDWQVDNTATRTGQLVGTPAYMSPEQAEGGTIDARTDVFAMGAILFELLTGTTPLLPPESGCETIGGLIQHVLSYQPELPSQRAATLDAEARLAMAAELGLPPNHLKKTLQGDLDWVCLKATEKNRVDRYATSDDFADDLQRILDNQPVTVAQSSLLYRTKKLYQRRKRTILTTIAVGMLLTATAAFVGWNEYQRGQKNAVRIAELTGVMDQTLEQAFNARERAGLGGENANQYFAETIAKAATASKTADELTQLTPASNRSIQDLQRRLTELETLIDRDRAATELVAKLDAARERATRISRDASEAFSRQAGIEEIAKAFRDFGVTLAQTDPREAAKMLGQLPPYAQANVIETLDFLLAEAPTGAGIYLHFQDGKLTIADLVEGGPAANTDRLRNGDRVLKIDDLNLVDGTLGAYETLRSLAYQQLFGPPGQTLRITVIRDQFEPFSVDLHLAGKVNRWTQTVLKTLDPDPWRTDLRQAILTGDLATLKRLGRQAIDRQLEIETQPAFSLIQLASTQFLLERSNQSIDYLRSCQESHRDHFWANHYLGVALSHAYSPPKPNEGIRYLMAAVALRPNSIGARMNLASGYFYVGDLKGQLKELQAAHAIDPSYEPLKKQIAMLESALSIRSASTTNNLNLASTQAPLSIDFGSNDFDKDSFEYWEARAREKATAGDRGAAMAALHRLKQLYRDDPRIGRARGAVLLDLNDVMGASIVLAAAARAMPKDAATRFYNGVALQHAGKFQEALHEYRAAVSIQPNYTAAQQAAEALASFAEELR